MDLGSSRLKPRPSLVNNDGGVVGVSVLASLAVVNVVA
jgi:hypothetical protein